MNKTFQVFLIFLLGLISGNLKAVEFDELTQDEQFELYNESCGRDQFASCYQVAHWYLKNKRLDPVDFKNSNNELTILREKRKKIKSINEVEELSVEELDKISALKLRLVPEEQVKISKVSARKYLQVACNGGEKIACKELAGNGFYNGSSILYYAGLILFGLATYLIAKTIFQDEDEFQAQEKLDEAKSSSDEIAKHGIILRYSRPFFKRYFSPVVSGMKNRKSFKEKYRRKLAAAGLTNILTPEDFFAFKLFLIIGFPVVFLVIRGFLEETWPLHLIAVMGSFGFFYPDIWIKGKIENRQRDIIRAMPFSVDMLALSVEAGLDFIAAMSKVIEKAKASPLTEEFEILIREIKIGASRADALRNLAWRIDLIQISSFCATLIAADSVGASIGPILKSLAVEIRQKKSADVEKAGATAATKILFPMMFLIIPSVMIIIFSPMVLEAIRGK